ncbi:MAG: hypothetical protein IPL46_31415 [Saprospiraceae bacterium]|nr:hypothetical protein [Saprospiraceae bacterium]
MKRFKTKCATGLVLPGDAENLSYSLHSKALLNDEMLDFGTEANPLMLDYNGDGLKDLVVGSRFHEDHLTQFPSQLFLLQNTGTAAQPSFTLVTSDWLNLSTKVGEVDALFPQQWILITTKTWT